MVRIHSGKLVGKFADTKRFSTKAVWSFCTVWARGRDKIIETHHIEQNNLLSSGNPYTTQDKTAGGQNHAF